MSQLRFQKGIPRLYPINLSELHAVILNYASILGLEEQILNLAKPLIIEEVYNTLISSNPDRQVAETQPFINVLIEHGVTLDQFIQFKQGLLNALNRYLTNIELITCQWKEHANPYLTWRISDDQRLLLIMFNPVNPSRDYDEVLRREVQAAIDAGEFVPYKYLRILGMC